MSGAGAHPKRDEMRVALSAMLARDARGEPAAPAKVAAECEIVARTLGVSVADLFVEYLWRDSWPVCVFDRFRVGDVVRLKGDRRQLTVVSSGHDSVSVAWFDNSGASCCTSLPAEALVKP